MLDRSSLAGIALLTAMTMAAQAHDESKYPNWKGQWSRSTGPAQWDPKKPAGLRQEPPLTSEYQAIWEANMASQASGGEGYNPQAFCLPSGMPRMMIAYEPLEIIVTAVSASIISASFAASIRMVAARPTLLIRPTPATPSADGLIATATADTTCSRLRHAT